MNRASTISCWKDLSDHIFDANGLGSQPYSSRDPTGVQLREVALRLLALAAEDPAAAVRVAECPHYDGRHRQHWGGIRRRQAK